MNPQQTIGLRRNPIDKFYTRASVADSCIQHIGRIMHVNYARDIIIEPSAGNGSFIPGIKSLCQNHLFYDIDPAHTDIIPRDYMTFDASTLPSLYSRIHIVGNPPFGRQSSLAIRFIKKSCEFCDSVSFILPKSFKKESLKKHFPLAFHLVFECDLPDKSFLVEGVEHDVPCVFQIWEKKNVDRPVSNKLEPTWFQFVQKHENPDISIRRVGVNAGAVDTMIETKSTQSHYFIRILNHVPAAEVIPKLSQISYDFNNTVGPKSISKQELIKEFIKIFWRDTAFRICGG